MSTGEPRDTGPVKERWDERAKRYDGYYETFRGAVEHYVDWELLQSYLPPDRKARILDAAGGTGRMTLPLAKMGYAVTLCDISPGMLEVARQKLLREGLLDRVKIQECDVRELGFPDESYDFVLCWNGTSGDVRDLVRVTKKRGRISVFLVNGWRAAIDLFSEDPGAALARVESRSNHLCDQGVRYRVFAPQEAREFLEARGVKVLDMYGVCGWTDVLRIPQEIGESSTWDEELFRQTTRMILGLSREPSVQGMSRHLVLYGEKA
jgi:SAM-dependent methyltransferase